MRSIRNLLPGRRAVASAPPHGAGSVGASGGGGAASSSSARPPPFVAWDDGGGGAGAEGARRPVWVSIDPRTGQVVQYPVVVAERLEAGLAGDAREVRLAGFGGVYESLVVYLDGGGRSDDGHPVQVNALSGGKRDVRRMLVSADATQVRVHVYKQRGWRFSDGGPVTGMTEERQLPLLSPDDFDTDGAGGGADGPPLGSSACSRRSPAEEAAEREARLAVAEENRRTGLVGLWEWCRVVGYSDPSQLMNEDVWGVYSPEQNEEIEAAWAAGRASVSIAIGIRNYDITFRGKEGGRQIDKALRKSRLVRRRGLAPPARTAALAAPPALSNAASGGNFDEDGDCAICFTSFAETPSMPVITLPTCGHSFHGACVQHIADKKGTCPFCRAEVDWASALANPAPSAAAATAAAAPPSPGQGSSTAQGRGGVGGVRVNL